MVRGLTRREFVKGALIGAAALSCATNPFSANAAETIKRGGVWRYARNRTIPSLDAHRVSETFDCIAGQYDYLVGSYIDPKTLEFKLVPGLATEWVIENNNKRLVFTLRKGVLFHDGSKLDAVAAKWNIDRMRSHPKSFIAPDLKEIDSVDVLNDNSIAINLKYPSAGLIYTLTAGRGQGGFVSKSFQEKHGDDELARKGCGSGPFRYKEWVVDEKVVLERFPDYWAQGTDGKALPYLDGIEEHYRPKIDQAVLDLRSGGLDTVRYPSPRDVAKIREASDLEYVEFPPFEYHDVCCGFNPRKGPFTSLELRRACCYAIDRARFAKIVGFGVARPHMYPYIAEGQSGWAPKEWTDYTYNPGKAKELAKVAYPNGVSVKVSVISREPDITYGELLKAMWEAVGIKTELKMTERLEWINSMKKDEFEIGFWQGSTNIGSFNRFRLGSNQPGNWSNVSDPQIDKILDEHNETASEAKRGELMSQALKIVYDHAILTSAMALTHAVGTHKRVKGLRSTWRGLVPAEVWLA
jgi:peptide/nickel transport system substrate-binding protein